MSAEKFFILMVLVADGPLFGSLSHWINKCYIVHVLKNVMKFTVKFIYFEITYCRKNFKYLNLIFLRDKVLSLELFCFILPSGHIKFGREMAKVYAIQFMC